jgi:hypothetical protein
MRNPPNYIVKSGVLDLPLEFSWKGEGMHFGASDGTKLHDALCQLTTRGLAVLSALVEEWLILRLRQGIDAERLILHVDATLAWAVDYRYRDESSLKGTIPSDSPATQAVGDGIWIIRVVSADEQWNMPKLPFDPNVYSLINITKQTLPAKPKKEFMAWVDSAIAAGAKLDPRPAERMPQYSQFGNRETYKAAIWPYFGTKALPREAFDPESGYKPEQREELLDRFLAGLDWKTNPFLRSPEDMKKLGFEGTPYKL